MISYATSRSNCRHFCQELQCLFRSEAAFSEWVVRWQAKEMEATNDIPAFRSDGYFKSEISRKNPEAYFCLLDLLIQVLKFRNIVPSTNTLF
jgi:hypothetical protein